MTDIDALIASLRAKHAFFKRLSFDGSEHETMILIRTAAAALESLAAELQQERERAENGSCWDDGPQTPKEEQ